MLWVEEVQNINLTVYAKGKEVRCFMPRLGTIHGHIIS